MPVKDALRFIERLDEDVALQCSLRELSPRGDLEAVVCLAADAGFTFTPDELRAAFRSDWRMRRRFFGGLSDAPDTP